MLHRPALVPGDLDDHKIVGPVDAQIVVQKIVRIVLAHDLKAVVFRDAASDHGFIDDATDPLAIGRVLPLRIGTSGIE